MMITGILLALLTGMCWTAFGIALSFTARGRHNVVAFGIVQNLVCMILTFGLFSRPAALGGGRDWALFALVFSAGFLNALGQFVTNRAMKQGHNGIAWAISQSSMIVPFIVAALFFAQHGTPRQWFGIALILAGIILPNLQNTASRYGWLGAALGAFLLFGTVQTLYLLPALLDIPDPAGFRPVWAALGMAAGWSTVGILSRQPLKPNPRMCMLGCFMALISAASLLLFFRAVDCLSQAGAGNIAVPLMVGANILFFTLFSVFKIREKTSQRVWWTLALLLAGLCALS